MFPCLHVSMSPYFHVFMFHVSCFHVFMFSCFHVSLFPCFHVSLSPCLHVSMFPCFHVSMFPCLHVSGIPQKEKSTNGKQKLPFVFCKQKTETTNFRLFAANGNGKHQRTFVFLGRQTINGNRQLLFQQTFPSMRRALWFFGHLHGLQEISEVLIPTVDTRTYLTINEL
jgi:hypothetical protein